MEDTARTGADGLTVERRLADIEIVLAELLRSQAVARLLDQLRSPAWSGDEDEWMRLVQLRDAIERLRG